MSGRYDLAGDDDGSAFGALTGAGATGFCIGGVGRFGTGGSGGRLLPGGATFPSTRVNSLGPAANSPKGINDAFTLTESFTDYAGPVGTPDNLSKNISEGNSGVFGDTQYLGKTAPSCLGTDDHETMKQHFSAKVGNKTFPISTVVSISRGRFAGTNKVDVSISTP